MERRMVAGVAAKTLLLALLVPVVAAAHGKVIVGTYSSLSYNKESDDLNGIEISLVPVEGGLSASVQVAEDGVNEVHLAEVAKKSDVFIFSIRMDDGSVIDFSMACTLARCRGEYEWRNGKVPFILPKSIGYWNGR